MTFKTFTATLIVDQSDGVIGTDADYDIEQEGQVKVEVTLNIPEELFKPIKVKIDFPSEFLPQEAIKGEPESISVPIVADGKNVSVLVESLEKSNGRKPNILGLLKRAIFGEKKVNE